LYYSSGALCIRGVGFVLQPSKTIFELLCDVNRRKKYDASYLEGSVIKKFTPHIQLVHQVVQVKSWFSKHTRDSCVIMMSKALGQGRYAIVQTSIRHQLCPETNKYTRSEVHLSGWYLQPMKSTSIGAGAGTSNSNSNSNNNNYHYDNSNNNNDSNNNRVNDKNNSNNNGVDGTSKRSITIVTFVTDVSWKGQSPSWFIEAIGEKYPLMISNLNSCFSAV
jgi:hypothetical protein